MTEKSLSLREAIEEVLDEDAFWNDGQDTPGSTTLIMQLIEEGHAQLRYMDRAQITVKR